MPKHHKTSSDVKKALELCTMWNYTPDLPLLRYAGPQRVFLWDDIQHQENLRKRFDLEAGKDFITNSYRASTYGSFVPVKTNDTRYRVKYYLPDVQNWGTLLADDQAGYWPKREPLPVRGRVLTVSLKAMQALDDWYGNGIVAFRRKMPVYLTPEAVDREKVSAWVYLHPFSNIMKWNPHTGKYRFPEGFNAIPVEQNHAWHGRPCWSTPLQNEG